MDLADYNLTSPNTTLVDHNRSSNEDEARTEVVDSYYSNIFQKTKITLYSIIFILGIIGNGLVIWIAGFRMKKIISAVWFLHLAIADFLCCAYLPFKIADEAKISPPLPVTLSCILAIILFNVNMSASVLLLTAMSVDRWVSVMCPIWAKVHRTQKLVRTTAGSIWAMSLLMTSLVFYSRGWCVYKPIDYKHIMIIRIWIELFSLFLIPFLIISTSYVTIYLKLRKSKRPQRYQRPYRIITAVILCFFICWAPYNIYPLIPLQLEGYVPNMIRYIIVSNLTYLNSCINPIIYVFMGQDFRHGFLRSIPFRLQTAISDPSREREDCEIRNHKMHFFYPFKNRNHRGRLEQNFQSHLIRSVSYQCSMNMKDSRGKRGVIFVPALSQRKLNKYDQCCGFCFIYIVIFSCF
ncbi:formyl peptide receptor 2-like [Engystomops pustulosus]|uniref:formyl peptide receptor 2-like n=1 Tax=Engystomops pustulosus TaxID=76066 RepID=UPI003AFABB1E